MAEGRTISAKELTKRDREVLRLTEVIAEALRALIPNPENAKEFWDKYGKVNYSRDAGLGVGGGKLQRDGLCTRGRSGKLPFSNRNLRWHPLTVAETVPASFKPAKVELDATGKELRFRTADSQTVWSPDKVHDLPGAYCIASDEWKPLAATLKMWDDATWTKNSCIIPVYEYCPWLDAVETFAVLGVSIASALYRANLNLAYEAVSGILSKATIEGAKLPTPRFPSEKEKATFVLCPLCRAPINGNPAQLPSRQRAQVWQPAWQSVKRDEGEDSSLQVMHVNALVEPETRHHAGNVRYGHRWCNIAMSDHSFDETLLFMRRVSEAQKNP